MNTLNHVYIQSMYWSDSNETVFALTVEHLVIFPM